MGRVYCQVALDFVTAFFVEIVFLFFVGTACLAGSLRIIGSDYFLGLVKDFLF